MGTEAGAAYEAVPAEPARWRTYVPSGSGPLLLAPSQASVCRPGDRCESASDPASDPSVR